MDLLQRDDLAVALENQDDGWFTGMELPDINEADIFNDLGPLHAVPTLDNSDAAVLDAAICDAAIPNAAIPNPEATSPSTYSPSGSADTPGQMPSVTAFFVSEEEAKDMVTVQAVEFSGCADEPPKSSRKRHKKRKDKDSPMQEFWDMYIVIDPTGDIRPTRQQREQFMQAEGLTLKQVDQWFQNKRRREGHMNQLPQIEGVKTEIVKWLVNNKNRKPGKLLVEKWINMGIKEGIDPKDLNTFRYNQGKKKRNSTVNNMKNKN